MSTRVLSNFNIMFGISVVRVVTLHSTSDVRRNDHKTQSDIKGDVLYPSNLFSEKGTVDFENVNPTRFHYILLAFAGW